MHLLFFMAAVRLRERDTITLLFELTLLPYCLRYCCYLTVCVTAATLLFALLLLSYCLHCCLLPCRLLPPTAAPPSNNHPEMNTFFKCSRHF
ncbi:hypothetical protein [Methanimicrococcus blatticola]|uniref:hypothetical protein n=1 Tax=Methanimicrococcus blatticola TaxID=91560 RepID=UPI00105D072E|nr:hypothetical protein [Methanimicrococcus blatticola]MBZ3935747.1 hypothetical protein [Methanimicrococcus blatticola]MCC2508133.1 hypothetical protein [Methanimicrococcus blatticola]